MLTFFAPEYIFSPTICWFDRLTNPRTNSQLLSHARKRAAKATSIHYNAFRRFV